MKTNKIEAKSRSVKQIISVFVVDDHALFRQTLISFFGGVPGVKVIGQASNGDDALKRIDFLKPDVMLLDIEMPGMDGVKVLHRLKEKNCKARIIMLSMYCSETMVLRAVEAGAMGFISKNAEAAELIDAITTVADNHFFSNQLANDAMFHKISANTTHALNGGAAHRSFSEKELLVLGLLAEGLTSKEIGLRLFLSPRTIDDIRKSMMEKTNSRNVAALFAYAVKNRMVNL